VIEVYLQDDSGKKKGPFAIDDPKLAELIQPNSQVFPTHVGRWMRAADVKELSRFLDAKNSVEIEPAPRVEVEQDSESRGAMEAEELARHASETNSDSASYENNQAAESPEVEPEQSMDSESNVELSSWRYFLRCFDLYGTFSGRARRSEYWSFILWAVLLSIPINILDTLVFGKPQFIFHGVFTLVTIVPSLSAFSRRLHDTGRSAWWYLFMFTGIGAIFLIIWLFQDSKSGPNKWGPNPKRIN
jgi:uncharacterized membrane protein YhaH (DUF805 family)